jgi:hypothetical protein
MLDDHAAAAVAAAFLEEDIRLNPDPEFDNVVRVAPERGFKDGRHFVIPFDTVDFLDHGNEFARLAGNPPIVVDLETGACHFLDDDEELDYRDRGFPV